MRINVRGTETGASIDFIKSMDPKMAGSTDEVVKTADVGAGQELLLNIPSITDPSAVEYGNPVERNGEPTPTPEGEGSGAPAGGGNEGSAAQEATGDVPPATDDGEKGESTEEAAKGDSEVASTDGEPATTSAASETPLYLVEGDTVPDGFLDSGLETPDGKTLYHCDDDVAGGAASGNTDGVSVYAESAEDDKPVQPATPTA